jgi:hypothetical protein
MHAIGLVGLSLLPLLTADLPAKNPVGQQLPKFELRDYLGAAHSSNEWVQKKAVVVAFLSASQDIVIDASRIELLLPEEQGAAALRSP